MTEAERDIRDRPPDHIQWDTTDRMLRFMTAIGRDWAGNKGKHRNPPKRLTSVYWAMNMSNDRLHPWVRDDRDDVVFFHRPYDPDGDEDHSCWIEVSKAPIDKPAKRPKFLVRLWDRYDIYDQDARGRMRPKRFELTEMEVACVLAAAKIKPKMRSGWERRCQPTTSD